MGVKSMGPIECPGPTEPQSGDVVANPAKRTRDGGTAAEPNPPPTQHGRQCRSLPVAQEAQQIGEVIATIERHHLPEGFSTACTTRSIGPCSAQLPTIGKSRHPTPLSALPDVAQANHRTRWATHVLWRSGGTLYPKVGILFIIFARTGTFARRD
jgi:hypothetical protein